MESFTIWNVMHQRYSITLGAPVQAAHSYLRIFLYSILFLRGVEPAGGYVCETYDGTPMLEANRRRLKSDVESMIAEIQEWIKQKKLDHVALYIYDKHTDEHRESWLLYINASYEDTSQPLLDEFKQDILDVNRMLPTLDQPLEFYVEVFYDVINKKQFLHP